MVGCKVAMSRPGCNKPSERFSYLYTETRTAPVAWHLCIAEEVQYAIFHSGNTSPEPDEISPLTIKKACPIYKDEITFFYMCLEEGYHPLTFPNAILSALPKLGKQPKHLPRSYQLVALLSCLGKGLEKLVPHGLGDIALRY